MKVPTGATIQRLREVGNWPDLSGTRYELLEKIGQGGMGSVYRAKDRQLNREVAIKVLAAPVRDPAIEARMAKEVQIIAQLEHPGIVPIHDAGELDDGRLYFTMKLVRGQRLSEFAHTTGQLTVRLKVFEKICDAVAFAHSHGVIHRDLKPTNVMIGSFGEVLVMDWGAAKLIDRFPPPVERGELASDTASGPRTIQGDAQSERAEEGSTTAHGTIIGSPGYMSPEQARGDVELVDERSDVFALGAILRFLLAPTLETPKSPQNAVPPALEAICRKCQSESRESRYATVIELSEDIARYLAADPVMAYRERLVDRISRVFSKYRVPIFLVFAYLGMRVLLLFFAKR